MDQIDNPTLTLINIIMTVVLATFIWGISALIVFGVVMAPVLLVMLICLFIEAAFGIAPLSEIKQWLLKLIRLRAIFSASK